MPNRHIYMQAKSDKLEIGFIILTAVSTIFHAKGEQLGTQAMIFLGASLILYYIMRGVLYGRAFSKSKPFAAAGFGLFAYVAFIAIFLLSLLLKVPEVEGRLLLLGYAAPIPIAALAYLIMKYDRAEWLPFVVRIALGFGCLALM